MKTETRPSVAFSDLTEAAGLLAGVAHLTPVMTSRTLDSALGAKVFFKCESLQRAGAFKFRGAYNALSCHRHRHRHRQPGTGVVTASSGNHAQAMALAGGLLEVPVTIVMPDDAPQVKLAATRGYGGQVVLYDRTSTTREEVAERLARDAGLVQIPAFDHPDVIAGQGTAALELFQQVGELDLLLVCCGGGGLLAGSSIAAAQLSPTCRVIGVEPALADDAARSFRTGQIQTVHNPPTIADGARTPFLGELNFEIIQRHVADIVVVSERSIVEAMRFLWQRMKLVVEPTGALALAALLEGTVQPGTGARVGVTLTGGNVDLDQAASLFGQYPDESHCFEAGASGNVESVLEP